MRHAATLLILLMLAWPAAGGAERERPGPLETTLKARPGAPVGAVGSTTPSDYLIGPGDLLEVTVFEEDSLDRTVRVGPDGAISLPLLGVIQTTGRSKGELEAEIVRRLSEHFLYDPQVSVFVKEYRSKRVAIIGAVNAPGSYEMLGRRTLLEMISEAGGLAPGAGRDVFVFGRRPGGSMTRTRIDIQRLMQEGDVALNVVIHEGDIIHVPPDRPLAVYLYGAVGQPGMVEARSSEGLTLLQAIARAGGPAPRAALDKITIMRASPGGRVRLRANLKRIIRGKEDDLVLQADDIIVVPETFF